MLIERITCVEEMHTIPLDTVPAVDMIMDECVKAAGDLAGARPGSVQLIYIDPPFNTGKEFSFRQRVGVSGYKGNPRSQITHVAYADCFAGGQEEYLHMMRSVLVAAHGLLDGKGSIYVHVDYRTSAHIRLLLDEVFGQNNFINEIIWHYKSGGRATRHFSRKHDTIFLYKKGVKYRFNALAASSPRGKERRNHLRMQTDEDGRTYFSIRSNQKIYKYYEDTPVFVSDVWDDISHLQQRDPERTQYDTQKPAALLERIIGVSSNEGDVVADLFCGSGTTLETAVRMNRRAIGIDSSVHAVNVCRKRLQGMGATFRCAYGAAMPACGPVRLRLAGGMDREGGIMVRILEFGIALPGGSISDDSPQLQLAWMPHDTAMPECTLAESGAGSGPGGIEGLDYAALGYVADGVFHAADAHARSHKTPEIQFFYHATLPPGAEPALHMVDVFGHNHYFKLTM